MDRLRDFFWISFICAIGCAEDSNDAQNFLLISIDTWRADTLGAAGHSTIQTPNLDRLATTGVRAATALTHVPLTLPSHATMFTGLLPPALGLHDNAPFALPNSVPSLPAILQEHGYWCGAAIAGQPLASGSGLERGFDVYLDPPRADRGELLFGEWNAKELTDRALSLFKQAPKSKPGFFFVHYFDPHYPYHPPHQQNDWNSARRYQGEVEFVDQELGRLLRSIEQSNAPWLVLVTSDHGEGLGQYDELTHGYQVFDSTIDVPWILTQFDGAKWTRPAAFGHRQPFLVAHVDLLPTVLSLLQLEVELDCHGFDLTLGERPEAEVYVESLLPSLHFGWAQTTGLRTDQGLYLWTGEVDGPLPTGTWTATQIEPGEVLLQAKDDDHWREQLSVWRETLQRFRVESESMAVADPTLAPLVSLGYVGVAQDASSHRLLSREANRKKPSALSRSDKIEALLHAVEALSEQRFNAAYTELDKLVQEDPSNPTARFFCAKVCIELATKERSVQHATRAVHHLQKVLEISPAHPGAKPLLAKSAAFTGEFAMAIAEAQELVDAEPANPSHHELLGALLLEAGSIDGGTVNSFQSPEKGYLSLLQALALNPRNDKLRSAIARGLSSIATESHKPDWVIECQGRLAKIPLP